MKRFNMFAKLALVALSFVVVSASAMPMKSRLGPCSLGETCTLPAPDKMDVKYFIQTANGNRFQCVVVALSPRLEVWIKGGVNFTIKQGKGFYAAAPSTTIDIAGKFRNPNDPKQVGEIVIHTLSGNGTVNCYQ